MNKQFWLMLTLGGLSLSLATQVDARLYKWVDENGNVHYGDKIPARYAKQQHQELNADGVQVKKVQRQKTQAEYEAEKQIASDEEKRLERERRLLAEQSRKDQILLDTFTVERDLVLMREDRIGAIDSNIALTTVYNEQIQKRLNKTQETIDNLEKAKREIPDNLTKKIKNLKGQLQQNTSYLSDLKKQRILLEKQFADDLARFRELKGITPPPEEVEKSQEEPAAE